MSGPREGDDGVEIDHTPVPVCESDGVDAWLLWLIASGLFAAGEMASLDLVLLMFAGGALGGMTVALLGGPVVLQLVGFIVVSALLLVLVRPLAKRHLVDRTPEQLDGVAVLIGRTAKVTEAVDGHGGRIRLGADEWTARSQYGGEHFPVGTTVRILQVDGATAVVGDALELE
jgi:membrane protein implicated in regulation of membrane protease activity